MEEKFVPLDVLKNGGSLIKQPLNMAEKFVPLEVSSAGTDAKLIQLANMLLKFVFLAKFNFGIDANAEQPLNKPFASVTATVSNHGMVTKLLQLANMLAIFDKLRVFVKIGDVLSEKQPLNVLFIF